MNEQTEGIVSAILAAGGFEPMPEPPMKGLLCKEIGGGWWMGGVHASGVHSKHTLISERTTNDPIEAAHELVALANRGLVAQTPTHDRAEHPEPADRHDSGADPSRVGDEGGGRNDAADELDGDRLSDHPSDADAASERNLASETPQDETHGETGEETQAEDTLLGGEPEARGDLDSDAEWRDPDPSERESVGVVDADFTVHDLPEIELIEPDENPDFGSDVLAMQLDMDVAIEPTRDDDQAARDAAFIFGDNLHQMRTAAIGLVMQHALALMPEPTDYARLSELRNFTLGVSEGRWPDDPVKREDLDVLEATERRRHEIAASRDEKVGYLMTAEREAIEAFDATANWP